MKQGVVILVTLLLIVSVTGLVVILSHQPDIDSHRKTIISYRVDVSMRNTGDSPAYDIPLRLAVPTDMPPYQFLENVSYSESPERNTTDSLANTFAHYSIPRLNPQSYWNVSMNITMKLMSVDFNIRKDRIGEFGEEENLSRYLTESSLINFNDPEIVDRARKISGDSNEIPEIVWETYDWVVENIDYQQLAGERDAASTLKNREGGSAELGNLHVALLRANGIPARRVSGYGNHFHEGEELYLSQFAHGWTEFYLPNYGWIPSDPTWGQAKEFDNFAKTDDDHIGLTKGAGIHFLRRGDFSEPFGDTEVNTDYKLTILEIKITNLSTERDIITAIIFGIPVVFAVFIFNKRLRQRHV